MWRTNGKTNDAGLTFFRHSDIPAFLFLILCKKNKIKKRTPTSFETTGIPLNRDWMLSMIKANVHINSTKNDVTKAEKKLYHNTGEEGGDVP
jgi:hypothetical protein